jgi:hypothetical protein
VWEAALAALFVSLSTPVAQTSNDFPTRALRFFEGFAGLQVDEVLRALRRSHVTADERTRTLANLPDHGEVRPDRQERAKLTMLQVVLNYHDRADVFDIKVIDFPQATVALHHRVVLLISLPALRLFTGAELQAMVAHEIGHDYFWSEFERTTAEGDQRGRRELELKCDGIAVLTLLALHLDPTRLGDGLRKLTRFNERFGANANPPNYPRLDERQRFITALRKFAEAQLVTTAR